MSKKKLTNRDLDFMLFECEMHRLLDLIEAPPGQYICKRLREYAESKGIKTDWDAEVEMAKEATRPRPNGGFDAPTTLAPNQSLNKPDGQDF